MISIERREQKSHLASTTIADEDELEGRDVALRLLLRLSHVCVDVKIKEDEKVVESRLRSARISCEDSRQE
jgi:hypothetical protein